MKAKEFFNLTREFWQAQKEYIKTKDEMVLAKYRLLEADLDAEIERVTKLGY